MITLDDKMLEARLSPRRAVKIAAEAAWLALDRARYDLPARQFLPVDDAGAKFGLMPILLRDPSLLGVKIINIFPANPLRGKPSHLGQFLLYSGETGEPLASLDAHMLTAIRTAAMSALATRLLARPDSARLGIIGTGTQALWHAVMIAEVLPLRAIDIAGRNAEAGHKLVADLGARFPEIDVRWAEIEATARQADVLCTVTSSRRPVARADWMPAGQHINAVGAYERDAMELEPAHFAASFCATDNVGAIETECGEMAVLRRANRHQTPPVVELGELLTRSERPAANTLYKSFGSAVEDMVFAMKAAW